MALTDEQITKLAEDLHKTAATGFLLKTIRPMWAKFLKWGTKNYQGKGMRAARPGDVLPGTTRTMWGAGPKAKFKGIAKNTNPNLPTGYGHGFSSMFKPKHILAEIGHNLSYIKRKGVLNFLDRNVRHARRYETQGGVFKRSLPGQVLNVAMTGPGFAATDILLAPKGQSTGKTLGVASADMALWSLSPRLGGGALFARLGYDTLKKFKKPQQPKLTNIHNDTQIIQ